VQARNPDGKQVWTTLGDPKQFGIDAAREKARQAIRATKAGRDIGDTFRDVAERWFERHIERRGVISGVEIRRCLDKHILPAWGERTFASIRRSDVADFLDTVEDECGTRSADSMLAHLRNLMNWYSGRDEDYVSPIARNMRRQDPSARDRILNDDELRAVWETAEDTDGPFGAFIRLALLTGQRRTKVASMRFDAVVDGVWTVPQRSREKGVGGELGLPQIALDIIAEQPRYPDSPYVMTGAPGKHFDGFSQAKLVFDGIVKIAPWRIHDLRRTSRSLMARTGVRPDVAEKLMGHAVAGVEAIYDRHTYNAEKADALRKLAFLIDTIVHPPVGNVVPLAVAS
jgi:integrase